MAAIGIPAALVIVYLGGWVLAAVVAALGVAGTGEVYRLARVRDVRPFALPGQSAAALLPFAVFATFPGGLGLDAVWLALGAAAWIIIVMLAAMATRTPGDRVLSGVAVTIFGPLYAAGLPAFLIWLRHGDGAMGRWPATGLVFLPLVVTWLCDTAAMLGGAVVGGRKLAPVVSPGKTWAGAVAGLVGAVLVALAYGQWVLGAAGGPVPPAALVLVGVAIGTLGQLGDLAESLLKREAGLKDSGTLFAAHGGVLDRLDSLYFGIPLTALVLHVFGTI